LSRVTSIANEESVLVWHTDHEKTGGVTFQFTNCQGWAPQDVTVT
jgi:hypothetical protein